VGAQPLWRAFEANEITHSGAHYLLAIAALAAQGEAPRAADVARFLSVSRAATSLQLRTLQEHGLVESDASLRLRLTRRGKDLVGRVASKRKVLQVFLADILGIREELAEVDACKVEHLLSEDSGAALVRWVRFLRSGHPSAAACLAAFRETLASCPHDGHCELCAEACLLAASGRPDEVAEAIPLHGGLSSETPGG
jgi:DtxR family transcriptional regulator, Mn-dependent transcriptional regulator